MKTKNRKNLRKILYWAPRVMAMLFTVFVSMFAFDVFGEYGFPEVLVALFMHLVPTFLVLIATVVAWRWEKVGGIIFIGLGVFYIIMTRGKMDFITYLLIPGPVFLTGVLFLAYAIETNSKKK